VSVKNIDVNKKDNNIRVYRYLSAANELLKIDRRWSYCVSE